MSVTKMTESRLGVSAVPMSSGALIFRAKVRESSTGGRSYRIHRLGDEIAKERCLFIEKREERTTGAVNLKSQCLRRPTTTFRSSYGGRWHDITNSLSCDKTYIFVTRPAKAELRNMKRRQNGWQRNFPIFFWYYEYDSYDGKIQQH
jgi:hypothetical protein